MVLDVTSTPRARRDESVASAHHAAAATPSQLGCDPLRNPHEASGWHVPPEPTSGVVIARFPSVRVVHKEGARMECGQLLKSEKRVWLAHDQNVVRFSVELF